MEVRSEFGVWDYLVFATMLVISTGIGVFFACQGGQQKTQGEYLLANRNMPILPVAVSILVSFMSAILILGTPAEMYTQGTEFYTSLIGMCLGIILAAVWFVPLFFPLKITSVFEYLERRFNSRRVRLLGTWMMILSQIIYMGLASFAPCTAFQAVTGFPIWATIVVTSLVATFYTCVGGMKGVVWADVFQAFVMLAGMLAILIKGVISVGSLERVWELNDKWNRIKFFNFDPNPTVRHTFWSLVIGGASAWAGNFGMGQASVQRYCSLSSLRRARISILLNIIGCCILVTTASFTGVVVFAYYAKKGCDPLKLKLVDNPNQLIPYFVMETLNYPGLPGLFIACLFSGALSSVSSSLNSLAAVTWEDMLKPRYDLRWSEYQKTVCTKVLVLLYGCLSTGVSFVAVLLDGTILQATVSFMGAIAGPLSGIFMLAAFFPWANSYGAIVGGVSGLVVNLWLSIGSYVEGLPKLKLPSPDGQCYPNISLSSTTVSMTTTLVNNITGAILSQAHSGSPFRDFYKISYLWFTTIGILTVVIVGLIVSFITGATSAKDVSLKFQVPVLSRLLCCLPKSWLYILDCCRSFPDLEDAQPAGKVTKCFLQLEPPADIAGFDNIGFDGSVKEGKGQVDMKEAGVSSDQVRDFLKQTPGYLATVSDLPGKGHHDVSVVSVAL